MDVLVDEELKILLNLTDEMGKMQAVVPNTKTEPNNNVTEILAILPLIPNISLSELMNEDVTNSNPLGLSPNLAFFERDFFPV